MFITGPDVIKTVTHEEVTKEELGGAHTHASALGRRPPRRAPTSATCARDHPRAALLPAAEQHRGSAGAADAAIRRPRRCRRSTRWSRADSTKPYDIKEVITARRRRRALLRDPARATRTNIVVGFARIDGRPVGIVANQPAHLAGCLDIDASVKAARFVRFCDCFNIPLVTFVDVPGFLPGTDQEYGGIIKHGAKLLYAFAEATVPKVTVITRKAYGGAYDVMASKHIRADVNLAYPTAEIAVMGPDGAVNIVYRNEIDKARRPGGARRRAYVAEYREKFANPYKAAELGYIDEVIHPRETRAKAGRRAAHAAQQATVEPAEEARQHSALKTLHERVAARPLG